MQNITYHIFPGSISLYAEGRFHLVAKGDPRFAPLSATLAAGDIAGACRLLAEAAAIDVKKIVLGEDGVMRYEGREIPTVLSDKYVELHQAGKKNAVGILNYWLNETLSGRGLDLAFLNRVVPLPSCYPATPHGFHILYDAAEAGYSAKNPAFASSFYRYDHTPTDFRRLFAGGMGLGDLVQYLYAESAPSVVRRLETLLFNREKGSVDCSLLYLGGVVRGLLPTNQLLELLNGWSKGTDAMAASLSVGSPADLGEAEGDTTRDETEEEARWDETVDQDRVGLSEEGLTTVRRVLSLFTPIKIRNFLMARPSDETLQAIAASWPVLSGQLDLTARRFSSLSDVADLLRLEAAKLNKEDYPLAMENRRPALAQINGALVGPRLTLKVPSTNSQLVAWSTLLGNCLHSYGKRCASGEVIIVGVEEDGKLRYAVEIADGRIHQFSGKASRRPTSAVRLCVAHTLMMAGLLKTMSGQG